MGLGDCLEHSEESTFTGLMVGLVTQWLNYVLYLFICLFVHSYKATLLIVLYSRTTEINLTKEWK